MDAGRKAVGTALRRASPPGVSKQEAIRAAVTDYIVANSMPAGALLPTELVLMDELGVGRNALREAMKALEALGIVQIRHGFGTYVGNATLAALESGLRFRTEKSLHTDLSEIRNLLDVREVLEVGLASRVVSAVAPSDLALLDDIVDRMESTAAGGEYFPALDWQFHEALYVPLGNALIVDLLRVFWQVFSQVDAELPGARYAPAIAVQWHRDILDAIHAGDGSAASGAMGAHFSGIRGRLEV